MVTSQDNHSATLYAGIEAGGTKFNCVVGSDPLHVTVRAKFPTTTPEETPAKTCEFFTQQRDKQGQLSALEIACFGPVDLQRDPPTYGYITATPKKTGRIPMSRVTLRKHWTYPSYSTPM